MGTYFSTYLYTRHLCRGVYSFRLSMHTFVRLLLSVTFVDFTSKFLVKVSLSEYIYLTIQQNAFIFKSWEPESNCIHAMSFGPRVNALGAKGQNLGHC